jgi:hypothetical protein
MNERIKELTQKANIRFGRMAILDGDPRGTARFVSYSELEKFAELLVLECAGIANIGLDPDEDYLIGDDILEYFGVEE